MGVHVNPYCQSSTEAQFLLTSTANFIMTKWNQGTRYETGLNALRNYNIGRATYCN